MPRVGFEITIPVFEKAKTVHALDGAATVIGSYGGSTVFQNAGSCLLNYIALPVICI
jgi:hypothetical protein